MALTNIRNHEDVEVRRMSAWLIKHLHVKESFNWLEEIIGDSDGAVASWGLGILDQLLWTEIIHYEVEKEQVEYLFQFALERSDGKMQETIDFIRGYIEQRKNL